MGGVKFGPRNQGLSIGELVVATGLLALMLVTVVVLFGQMLKATSKSTMLAQGAFFAEERLDTTVRLLKDTPVTTDPIYSDWNTVKNDQSQTTFIYKMHAYPAEPSFPDPNRPGEIYGVEVEVRWWQDNLNEPEQIRQGMGRLSVKRRRLVYVQR